MLQKLEDKFKDERNELEKAEMEAKHAHEMVVQDLDGQIRKLQGLILAVSRMSFRDWGGTYLMLPMPRKNSSWKNCPSHSKRKLINAGRRRIQRPGGS